jgi:putative copper resistance protein D
MAGDAFTARPNTLRLVLEQTHFGRIWQAALTLVGLLAGLVWAARSAPPRTGGAIVVLVFSAGLLVSAAAAGHGAMDEGTAGLVHFTSHTLHLMAGAAWIGGLVPLGWVLRRASRTASAAATAVAVRCLVRFSSIGLVAVATLVLTGLINAAFLVGDPEGAWTSDFGRVLLLKVALVVAMIAIAARNRLRWLPDLDPARKGPKTAAALAAVFRNVVVEQGFALMVVAAAALLGTLAPPLAG